MLLSIALFSVITGLSARSYFSELSRLELAETTRLASHQFEERLADPNLEGLCRAYVQGSNLRLSIIAPNGKVLADSTRDPESMQSHANRPEFLQALANGAGHDERKSATTGIRTSYSAIALKDGGGRPIAILRVALPVSIVESKFQALASAIVGVGLALVLLTALWSLYLAKRLSQPIGQLREAALRFASGELETRLQLEGPEEIVVLSRVMNGMAEDLGNRLAQIREQKNEAEAILGGMAEAVAVVDENLMLVRENPRFRDIFTSSGAGLSLISATRSTELASFVESSFAMGTSLEKEIVIYGQTPRHILARTSPIEGGRLVLVASDVTRQVRLETMRRDFVANVSHELKTPITSIKGAVETLQSDVDLSAAAGPDAAQFLAMASRQCERLEAIIEDILSLARLEQEEQIGIQTEECELRPILESARESVSAQARARSTEVIISCAEGLRLRCNPSLLSQAVMNLLDNAVKYSPVKTQVGVSARESGKNIEIEVIDQGRGIPLKDRERIFERFYRVDKARSRDQGGTGLGLSIVKHIVLAHRGSVSVRSEEGRGSTFIITLPR
jgi:two-component system phosphate regulon sensor histidine kinase PhoR